MISSLQLGDSPGMLARAIGNIVSRWVQETASVRSPVFAGPYRAMPTRGVEALRNESRMFAWRPVLSGLCATPVHYPHSALRTTLGPRPAQGFDARPLLRLFGDNVPEARAALRKWLARRPSERDKRQWELLCGLTLATGAPGSGFVSRKVAHAETASLVAAGGNDGVTGALKLLEAWVGTRLGGCFLDLHRGHDAVSARGRALVACLAVDHGLCSAASVARHFGKAKPSLSEQMSERKIRPADQAILAKPMQQIVEEALRLSAAPASMDSPEGSS